ncbi:SsgA family sporulation/cell division regulator [Streptomyces sp. NPDC002476]|uniref:SsgA family sporulation/cell division regulator n=1 Tax=Streptomyces sp. NPDC002476 TaxID=3364648 RepID=UPI0036ACAC06
MNNEVQDPVSAAFAMRLRMPQPYPCVLVTAFLYYSRRDPYAVRMTFRLSTGDRPVVWNIGRDLLRDGLTRLAGEGDVQVGPDPTEPHAIFIRLRVDGDSSILMAQRQPVVDFLQRSAEIVPYGREMAVTGVQTSLDTELTRILASS